MSAQSVITRSLWTFEKELKEKTEINAQKLIFNKVYALGESYCEDSQNDTSYLLDIINMDNNTINCLIERALKGENISNKTEEDLLPTERPFDYSLRPRRYSTQGVSMDNQEEDHEHILFNTLPSLPMMA